MSEPVAPVRLRAVIFFESEEGNTATVRFYFGPEEMDDYMDDRETLEEKVEYPAQSNPDQVVAIGARRMAKRLEKAAAFLSQKYGREG